MKRLIALSVAIAASLALAACGGGGSSNRAASAAGSPASTTTVSVRRLSGVGSVLVDHAGKPLYSSDLEARGRIVCDAACNAFWAPLTLGAGRATAPADAGRLGVITRPDGTRQVTDNGKPLYTFAEDSPGKATGNGFHDEFNGHHFTWSIARAGGNSGSPAAGGSPSGGSTSGSGYSGGGGSSGGY